MLLFLHYARKFSETCVFKLVLDFLSSKAVGIVEPSDQTTEATMSLWVISAMIILKKSFSETGENVSIIIFIFQLKPLTTSLAL